MVDLLEKTAPQVEAPPMSDVTGPPFTAEVEKRPLEGVVISPAEPRFMRWMGWLMGLVLLAALVVGGVFLWNNLTDDLVAPSIESIDPHQSPEIMRISAVPWIESIDPHESPEIIRIP